MKTLKYGSEELWEIIDKDYMWMTSRGMLTTIYTHEPYIFDDYAWALSNGRYRDLPLNITDLPDDWRESKRQRPEESHE